MLAAYAHIYTKYEVSMSNLVAKRDVHKTTTQTTMTQDDT